MLRYTLLLKKSIFIALFFLIMPFGGKAIFIDVRILSNVKSMALNFTCISGKYAVFSDSVRVAESYKNNLFQISIVNDKLRLMRNNEWVGDYISLNFRAEGLYNVFRINSAKPESKERSFDDELRVTIEKGTLRLINHTNIESYVAGVVQSEIGGMADSTEFYKVIAIITRTYALNNIMKHFKEGFNMCDGTHCQVFFNRCTSGNILQAVSSTFGEVIVDADLRMISAAYHANSGGQTCNSEDVWSLPTTYLKSVVDTFSLNTKNSVWESKIAKKDLISYLETKYNFNSKDTSKLQRIYNFTQYKRKVYLIDSVPLKTLRYDFKLRSAFFNILQKGDTLVLSGKGYGHGCGLSQEGALRMIQKGYSYKDVIRFYYKNVDIRKYEDIVKF
ncbi:MAG: SpoIID/LytB domain-containing protein [Bacteroidota bacterium]